MTRKIPPEWAQTAPPDAVSMDEWYFDSDGSITENPLDSARVEIVFYDANGAILHSVHGLIGSQTTSSG